jgi:hypothetical protein
MNLHVRIFDEDTGKVDPLGTIYWQKDLPLPVVGDLLETANGSVLYVIRRGYFIGGEQAEPYVTGTLTDTDEGADRG